jgi:transcription elongation factor GreB
MVKAPRAPAQKGPNYMTPRGLQALQAEMQELRYKIRPEVTAAVALAASNGDRSENADYIYGKRRLREIDSRLEFLNGRIESSEVIDPAAIKSDMIQFGATVTFVDEEDREKTYAIVGIDEADVAKGKISWVSPLGAALLKARARVGDWVSFQSPKGEQSVEVLKIEYKAVG